MREEKGMRDCKEKRRATGEVMRPDMAYRSSPKVANPRFENGCAHL